MCHAFFSCLSIHLDKYDEWNCQNPWTGNAYANYHEGTFHCANRFLRQFSWFYLGGKPCFENGQNHLTGNWGLPHCSDKPLRLMSSTCSNLEKPPGNDHGIQKSPCLLKKLASMAWCKGTPTGKTMFLPQVDPLSV